MKTIDKKLIEWAIHKIETEFNGEISLLIGRKGVGKLPEDSDQLAFDYFIPANDRGYGLARTFIIEDMGYDLFPMPWKRVESLANLNEPILHCLAEGEILYARNETDRDRFELLQKNLFNNLKNKDFVYMKSLEKINFAMDIYKSMLFEKNIGTIRKAAGGILKYTSNALAIINGTYISGDYGYNGAMAQLKTLSEIPDNYLKTYEDILKAKDIETIFKAVHHLIEETRLFLQKSAPPKNIKGDSFDYLKGWEEARYTFKRLEYACKNNQLSDCFNLGCYLQIELDLLANESGLENLDLLSSYDVDDLSSLGKRAKEIEAFLMQEIKRHNVTFLKYDHLDEFLKEQG